MKKCVRHSDCGSRQICSSNTCIKISDCSSAADCPVNETCHPNLHVCTAISCSYSHTNCPSGTFCSNRGVCQVFRNVGETCTVGEMCSDGAICWQEQCRLRCSSASMTSCATGLECRYVNDIHDHICLNSNALGVAAAGVPKKQTDSEDSNDQMFTIFIMAAGCLLIFCFILYIIMSILRRRKGDGQPSNDLLDISPSVVEAGMIQAPQPRPAIPPQEATFQTNKEPRSSNLENLPLDVIQEDEEVLINNVNRRPDERGGGRQDEEHKVVSEDDSPLVDTSPSPSVASVKELWEQRQQVISPTSPTLKTQSPLQSTPSNMAQSVNTDAEQRSSIHKGEKIRRSRRTSFHDPDERI